MFVRTEYSQKHRVIFLRHAQSEGNALGVLQGRSDYPLSAKGVAQAQALGRRWRDEGRRFNTLLSSPLLRARQTAEIIAEALDGMELELCEDWTERHNGRMDGLRPDEIDARGLHPTFLHIYQPVGETGESQWELFLRAGRAIQDLLRRPPGDFLIVSHGGIMNQALYAVLGIIPQANMQGPRFQFRNTSFAELEYDPGRHSWQMIRFNDRAHWSSHD